MNVIDIVYKALESINNVYYGWYRSDINNIHVTFFEYLETPEDYYDDDYTSVTHNIQVDIWAKDNNEDAITIKTKVIKFLKDNGFRFEQGQDFFETDTKIIHKAMRFNYEEAL